MTGHEDHIATGRATTEAWLETNIGELWYAAKTTARLHEWREMHDRFEVWMTQEPTGVAAADLELVVNLAGRRLERKRWVLKAHGS